MATHLDKVKQKMSKETKRNGQTLEEWRESRRLAWQMEPENAPHSMALEKQSKKDTEKRIREAWGERHGAGGLGGRKHTTR